MISSRAVLVLTTIAFISPTFSQEQRILKNKSPFTDKFSQFVKDNMELWHVPGISIAVVDGDDIWAEGYGIAKYPSEKATPETLYYTASTTKAFTAAAISLLIDNSTSYQNIAWDTPISHLLRDDFVLPNSYATSHITIEDALSHRTGMPRHDISYGGLYDEDLHKGSVRDVVRSLRYLPMTKELRTTWQYCNMMYIVASHLVQTLTGVWLGDFLKERIWEPLGMNSTYFSTPDAQASSNPLAQGYVYYKDSYLEVPYMDLTISSGAGSIVSNVLDYSKWLKSLLSSSGPISKAGHRALRTPRALTPDEGSDIPFRGPISYALGWEIGVYRGYEFLTHSGGMEAYSAEVFFFPELNWGAVSLGNTAVTASFVEMSAICYLLDEKLGVKDEKRFDWNKKYQDAVKARDEKYENVIQTYYPKLPKPTLPATLHLDKYTGTYFNPAYRNVTIVVKNKKLHFDRPEATWTIYVDLEHVSGDYFMAYMDSTKAPGLIFREAWPAEFTIGSDGIAKQFGWAAEPEMGPDGRIWFERVA